MSKILQPLSVGARISRTLSFSSFLYMSEACPISARSPCISLLTRMFPYLVYSAAQMYLKTFFALTALRDVMNFCRKQDHDYRKHFFSSSSLLFLSSCQVTLLHPKGIQCCSLQFLKTSINHLFLSQGSFKGLTATEDVCTSRYSLNICLVHLKNM